MSNDQKLLKQFDLCFSMHDYSRERSQSLNSSVEVFSHSLFSDIDWCASITMNSRQSKKRKKLPQKHLAIVIILLNEQNNFGGDSNESDGSKLFSINFNFIFILFS